MKILSGSSRIFEGGVKKIEPAAEKDDFGAVDEEVAEALRIGFQGLNFGIEAFCHCIYNQ